MQNEVSTWLSNPERKYEDGAAIFAKYNKNNTFNRFFTGADPGSGSMKYRMLVRKLQDINRILQANPTLIKSVPPSVKTINVSNLKEIAGKRLKELKSQVTPTITDEPIIDVKELPENLKVLYFKNKKLLQQRAGYHMKSKAIDESPEFDGKRKEIDDKIIQLDDEMFANRKQINDWWADKKSGKSLEVKEEKATLTDKVKKINNLNNYINRAKAKIKDFPEEAKKLNPKIEKWQKELDELSKE